MRARLAAPARDHLPDGEVHWPDSADVAWAGECWAIEAERTAKTVARTAAIMRELLTRTGDYGCTAAEARIPGAPPRHARAVYLCSSAALATVTRARDALGSLGARIEIRDSTGQRGDTAATRVASRAGPRRRLCPARSVAPRTCHCRRGDRRRPGLAERLAAWPAVPGRASGACPMLVVWLAATLIAQPPARRHRRTDPLTAGHSAAI